MKFFISVMLLFLSVGALAAKPLYTIYSSSPKGTYHVIASDIVKACPQLDIQIETTQGTLDNMNALITLPMVKSGHRFGFVQEDATIAIFGSAPKAKQLFKKIIPFFEEEVIFVVNKKSKISSLSDLNGKKISIGQAGSGIWFTANNIKSVLGIKWGAVEKSPEESILLVLTGELDAMVVVGGNPLRILDELGPKMQERISILSVDEPRLEPYYGKGVIKKETYLWTPNDVKTLSTRSMLIAATDVPDEAIEKLTGCLATNLPQIRKYGHKKWMEVKIPTKTKR